MHALWLQVVQQTLLITVQCGLLAGLVLLHRVGQMVESILEEHFKQLSTTLNTVNLEKNIHS